MRGDVESRASHKHYSTTQHIDSYNNTSQHPNSLPHTHIHSPCPRNPPQKRQAPSHAFFALAPLIAAASREPDNSARARLRRRQRRAYNFNTRECCLAAASFQVAQACRALQRRGDRNPPTKAPAASRCSGSGAEHADRSISRHRQQCHQSCTCC